MTVSHSVHRVELGNRDETDSTTRTDYPAVFSMVVTVEGVYREESNENVDAYLSAIGVPWIARKAAGLVSPTIGEILDEYFGIVCLVSDQRLLGLEMIGP